MARSQTDQAESTAGRIRRISMEGAGAPHTADRLLIAARDGAAHEASMRFKPLLSAFLLLVLAALSTSCQNQPTCPPGAKLMGAAPPNGDELWCQKTVDGKPVKDGLFMLFRPDGGRMIQGQYKDGKQNGEWKMWYDSGAIHSIDTYRDGVQDGPHTSWYPNGHLDAKGRYKNGNKDGVWKRLDPDGYRNWAPTSASATPATSRAGT
jgi:MORN repeat variant